MGGLGVKFQHFPLTLLVVLTTLTLPCERDALVAGIESDGDDMSAAATAADTEGHQQIPEMDYSDLPQHLKLGSQLIFSITVLQASGIPTDCTDVFCQFK